MTVTDCDTLHGAVNTLRKGYATRNPHSYEAFQTACLSLPGGSTRSSIFVDPFPLIIERGHDTTLVDMDRHEYLDFVSDFTSGIYGKTHPKLREAINEALDNGLQLGAHTRGEQRLARLITSRFPSIEQIRFANSGTEANLLAISTAIRYTGKSKVVVFDGGYHGSLLCHFHAGHDPIKDPTTLTAPYDYVVCPYNDLTGTAAQLEGYNNDIAAILVEPMLGAGGCIPGEPDFLHGLRKLADEHGAVLIFDEVQTARLAPGGRQQLLEITPDMTTIGKFFGGGFAFGAFGGKRDIMKLFDMTLPGSVSHGGTFNNSPVTMAAGACALEEILTETALRELNDRGDRMRDRLNQLFVKSSAPFEMTGLGSLNQLHCKLAGEGRAAGLEYVFFRLLEMGVWIAQRGLISLNLAMTEEDVEKFVLAFNEATAEVGRFSTV